MTKIKTLLIESKKVFDNYKARKLSDGKFKVFITGIEKCGTCSIEALLKDHGIHTIAEESNYDRTLGVLKYKLQYPDYQTLLIIRNPIDRIWSHYNFKVKHPSKQYRNLGTLEETVTKFPEIIQSSNYVKWINKWSFSNPIILKLEELKDIEGFQKLNAVDTNPMTRNQREFLVEECKKTGVNESDYSLIEHDFDFINGITQ